MAEHRLCHRLGRTPAAPPPAVDRYDPGAHVPPDKNRSIPHFLYNTLDAINWMAIDKDEYEVSNTITSLACILRCGISNSVDWLKQ